MIYLFDKKHPGKIKEKDNYDSDVITFSDKTEAYNYAIASINNEIAEHSARHDDLIAKAVSSHEKHVADLNKVIDKLIAERDK